MSIQNYTDMSEFRPPKNGSMLFGFSEFKMFFFGKTKSTFACQMFLVSHGNFPIEKSNRKKHQIPRYSQGIWSYLTTLDSQPPSRTGPSATLRFHVGHPTIATAVPCSAIFKKKLEKDIIATKKYTWYSWWFVSILLKLLWLLCGILVGNIILGKVTGYKA